MSISDRHTLVGFIAGKSSALYAQRLAKVGYKSTAVNPAKHPNVCVSIPFVPNEDITSNMEQLLGHIRTMLETAQDGIIRSLYESAGGALISVGDSDISVAACISYMTTVDAGGRLTAALLESWFDSQLKDNLFIAFAEKLGFTEVTADVEVVVNKHVAEHRVMIVALSGGKTSYDTKKCNGLLFDLSLSAGGVDDEICVKLERRLQKMIADSKDAIDSLMLGA